ncbi:MAG: hypothetical protein VX589_01535 [Myxococcota bacterium]|nr:hypothetical protein [Myxococcota bacterium]
MFRDSLHLSYWVFTEIGLGRLSVIGGESLPLFSMVHVRIQCPTLRQPVVADAQVVHKAGDVTGLSLESPQKILMALELNLSEPLVPLSSLQAMAPEPRSAQDDASPPKSEQRGGPADSIAPDLRTAEDNKPTQVAAPQARRQQRIEVHGPPDGAVDKTVAFGRLNAIRDLGGFLSVGSGKTLWKVFLDIAMQGQAGQLNVVTRNAPHTFNFDEQGRLFDFVGDLISPLKTSGILDGVRCESAGRREGTVSQLLRIRSGFEAAGQQMPSAEVKKSLLGALVDLLDRLGRSEHGQYFFEPPEGTSGRLYAFEFVEFGRPWIQRWIKDTPREVIDTRMNGRMHRFPIALTSGPISLDGLCDNDAERRFINKALGQGRVLRRLLTFSPLNRRATFRFLILLEAFRCLEYQMDAPFFADGEDIDSFLAGRVGEAKAGHFAALGLHPSAHLGDIERGFKRIQDAYGADSPLRRHSPRSLTLCTTLCELAADAQRFLTDPSQRKAYRRELLSQTERSGFASLLIDKLRLASMRGQRVEAARLRQAAAELCPRTYRQELMNPDRDDDEFSTMELEP